MTMTATHAEMFDSEMDVASRLIREVLPSPVDDFDAVLYLRAEMAVRGVIGYGIVGLRDATPIALVTDQIEDYAIARGIRVYYELETEILNSRNEILNG